MADEHRLTADELHDVLDEATGDLIAEREALLAYIAAQAALLAEARAALEPVVQRYTPQITVITEGVGAAVYYTCVPADDLRRAAEVLAKL